MNPSRPLVSRISVEAIGPDPTTVVLSLAAARDLIQLGVAEAGGSARIGLSHEQQKGLAAVPRLGWREERLVIEPVPNSQDFHGTSILVAVLPDVEAHAERMVEAQHDADRRIEQGRTQAEKVEAEAGAAHDYTLGRIRERRLASLEGAAERVVREWHEDDLSADAVGALAEFVLRPESPTFGGARLVVDEQQRAGSPLIVTGPVPAQVARSLGITPPAPPTPRPPGGGPRMGRSATGSSNVEDEER